MPPASPEAEPLDERPSLPQTESALQQESATTDAQLLLEAQRQGLRLHLSARSSTGYRSVSWDRIKRKFQAQITVRKQQRTIGMFNTAVQAAIAFARETERQAEEDATMTDAQAQAPARGGTQGS